MRDAAISAVRLARITLVVSTLIALTSTYLSLAVGNHWWPWQQDEALAHARLVTSYLVVTQLGDDAEGFTDTYAISIVNNSTAPARHIYLYMPSPATKDHGKIAATDAVGLQDVGPCLRETYQVSVFEGHDQPIDPAHWNVSYEVDGRDWNSIISGGIPKPTSKPDPSVIYGVGGLSHIPGWSKESLKAGPSNGPGCG